MCANERLHAKPDCVLSLQATATTFMLSKQQLQTLSRSTTADALEPALMAAVVDACGSIPTAADYAADYDNSNNSSSSPSRVSARIASKRANSSAKAATSASINTSSSEVKAVDTSEWKVIVLLYCGSAPLIEEMCSALQAMCPTAAIIGGVAGAGMRLVNGQVCAAIYTHRIKHVVSSI
jgi:hypothetical protein